MGMNWPPPPKPTPKPDPEKAALATKIAEIVTDWLNVVVIRPGPESEERECYDVAREVRESVPWLTDIIYQMLDVHEHEGTAPIAEVKHGTVG